MKKFLVLISTILILGLIGFAIVGAYFTEQILKEKLALLKTDSVNSKLEKFELSSIEGFPLILKKYFNFNVGEKVIFPRSFRIQLTGTEKDLTTGASRELKIQSYQIAEKPEFLKIKSKKFNPFYWEKTIDILSKKSASHSKKILSAFTTDEIDGVAMESTLISDYIFYSPYIPQLYLNREFCKWKYSGESEATANIKFKNNDYSFKFSFNQYGEIVSILSEQYAYPFGSKLVMGEILYSFDKYKTNNGITSPTKINIEFNSGDSIKFTRNYEIEILNYNKIELFNTRNY